MSSNDELTRSRIAQLIAPTRFIPVGRQIRARNEFWAQMGTRVLPDTELATVLQFGAPNAVSRWWDTPGFADWFTAPEYALEESERLLYLAMQRIGDILGDDRADTGSRIAAAREAREIRTRLLGEQNKPTEYADKHIAEMTPEELREYIDKHAATPLTSNK